MNKNLSRNLTGLLMEFIACEVREHSEIRGIGWVEGILTRPCKVCGNALILDNTKECGIHLYRVSERKTAPTTETYIFEDVCDTCHNEIASKIKFTKETLQP